MNIVLVEDKDFIAEDIVKISGRRFEHIVKVLKKQPQEKCRVGQYAGLLGWGEILECSTSELTMKLELTQSPPSPPPLTLVMALPRPKTLRKVLHCAGSLGIKQIYLFGSFKVDKSYWGTPFLQEGYLKELEFLALEQCVDSVPWQIHMHRFFKPFVEDVLSQVVANKNFMIFHPDQVAHEITPINQQETVICLGPEGGFTDYEVSRLKELKGESISLGSRILRTEVALPFLLGKLL